MHDELIRMWQLRTFIIIAAAEQKQNKLHFQNGKSMFIGE